MIVVADTSPLNYLILIDQVHVLPLLYGRISVPPAVYRELNHSRTPEAVKNWIGNLPEWLEVSPLPASTNLHIEGLGAGEIEAILLASGVPSSTLIIDEALGRYEASRLGLTVIGTLGILRAADNAGLLDLEAAVDRLRATTFRASPAMFDKLLEKRK